MIHGLLQQARRSAALSSPLRSIGAIDDVEALMLEQAKGARDEVVGTIAREHLLTGGKRVRARLALAAATALGVRREVAVPWASAVELLHNATLVHDDLQDGDVLRRGVPTTWAVHGAAQAINCGDLMLMLPVLALDRLPDDVDDGVRWRVGRALHERAVATVRGQGSDLSLRAQMDAGVDPVDAYLRCIEGKTGALFALPVEGAALLAGFTREQARALAEPFFLLGMLFQLQDDVLDLFGDKGRESRGSDVREGKISALVVEHLRLHPGEREWLMRILDAPREATTDDDVAAVIARFEHGGALHASLRRIVGYANRAHLLARDDGTHAGVAPHAALAPLALEVIGMVLAPIHGCFAQLQDEAFVDAAALAAE